MSNISRGEVKLQADVPLSPLVHDFLLDWEGKPHRMSSSELCSLPLAISSDTDLYEQDDDKAYWSTWQLNLDREMELKRIALEEAYTLYSTASTEEDKIIKRASFIDTFEQGKYSPGAFFIDALDSQGTCSMKHANELWDSQTPAERFIWEGVAIQMYKIRLSHP